MTTLLLFAFASGLVTIFAPCIWPLLPIVLSSSSTGGNKKPLGITLGIIMSFSFFTLVISYLVKFFRLDPNILRLLAVIIIGFLGLTLVVPSLSQRFEGVLSRFSGYFGGGIKSADNGFLGGLITGFSLGIVWSPCAGPILATIAVLAATRAVSFDVVLVTIVYVIGVGIPLFLFSSGAKWVFTKSRLLSRYTGRIQQAFGVIMIITALGIYTDYDKVVGAKLLDAVPSYSGFLNKFEGNESVQAQLDLLKGNEGNIEMANAASSDLPNLGQAPELKGITKWLNTQSPLSLQQLRGKVVLIDFWTYTCINCIRTLPHVTSWYEKYKDKGFVVIGVHTPEFEFEKDTENVERAVRLHNINYPVAQDNDYSTWRAYKNRYWPAEYLIDTRGNLRRTHFGEGEYDETEEAIKALLSETGVTVDRSLTSIEDQTPRISRTPETYFGLARLDRFASRETPDIGEQKFTISESIPEDYLAYDGVFNLALDHATPQRGSALEINFHADKVFLVATPKGQDDKVKVLLDGKPVDNSASGKDVKNSALQLDVPRMYHLIDLMGKGGNHILRLEFQTDDIALYTLTFG